MTSCIKYSNTYERIRTAEILHTRMYRELYTDKLIYKVFLAKLSGFMLKYLRLPNDLDIFHSTQKPPGIGNFLESLIDAALKIWKHGLRISLNYRMWDVAYNGLILNGEYE